MSSLFRSLLALCLALACLGPAMIAQSTEIPEGYVLVDDTWLPEDVVIGDSTFNATLWTNGIIPYEFDANVNATNQARTLAAMAEWEAVANVDFIPRTSQSNYLHIQSSNVNSSFVGMIGGGQNLNMFNWSFRFIIAHELGHALGVLHEQQRPDRNSFVTINTSNISSGALGNFNLVSGASTVGAYDFDSVLHYGQFAFSNNGQPTITVLPPNQAFQNQIGQREHLSILDAQGMANMYGAPLPPTISAVSPVNYSLGATLTLTITGTRFLDGTLNGGGVDGSRVLVDGTPVTTTFVNPTTLTAVVPGSLTGNGTLGIQVENPSPGGGLSATFQIGNTGPPTAAFSASPTSGFAPLTVNFTNSSTAGTGYIWNFGDGTFSTDVSPSHVYTTPGLYDVTLVVTGPGGTDQLAMNGLIDVQMPVGPPTAAFTATPTSGTAPLTVNFTDQSTGSITTRTWVFGDGSTSNAVNPTHTYVNPGTYTVTLVAIGPGGNDSVVMPSLITVTAPQPPVADFTATPTTGPLGTSFAFTDMSSGSITSWTWTFGDGTFSNVQNPSHVYTTPGLYSVSLSVAGPNGSDVIVKTDYIDVTAPPGGETVYLSFSENVTLPGLGVVNDEDIVAYDTATGLWSMHMDGSDVGLGGTDVAAFHVFSDGAVLFSISSPTFNLPGMILGPNGDQFTYNDLVYFAPTSLGANTAGTMVFVFDGSDVELDSAQDAIDGVYMTFDGSVLVVSTVGNPTVTGVGTAGAQDEDVLAFLPTSFFSATTGSWFMGFDGSDVGLGDAGEDIQFLDFDAAGRMHYGSSVVFSAPGVTGDNRSIARFTPILYGPATSGTHELLFDTTTFGIPVSASSIDGCTIVPN